jgi:membrane-anchored protein YejM (alkaline phosphatase superfamily)
MQAARRSPLLMDVLQQQNYQFSLHTSQSFTYPPFQETVFARMNPADMHALSEGPPAWQRDRQNIDDILAFIDSRDQSRPFMTYMFFEGTHANYTFPPESVIARPYLEDFNYLSADFAQQMVPIKNRYINAAHHVDQQIGRIIAHLRQGSCSTIRSSSCLAITARNSWSVQSLGTRGGLQSFSDQHAGGPLGPGSERAPDQRHQQPS